VPTASQIRALLTNTTRFKNAYWDRGQGFDPAERALGRLWLERFDGRLGRAYYAARRGDGREELDARLAELDSVLEAQPYLSGRDYGLADVRYVPWILRALERFGIELVNEPVLLGVSL